MVIDLTLLKTFNGIVLEMYSWSSYIGAFAIQTDNDLISNILKN